jgi:uncharacterized protein
VLTVLMLRGPQTPGELKQRTERLYPFADLGEVLAALESLAGQGMSERLPRRPGQKEERYGHLLGSDAPPATDGTTPAPASAPEPAFAATAAPAPPPPAPPGDDRLERLEREVAALRADLDALRAQLGD